MMSEQERLALVDRVEAVIEARLRLYLDEANAAPETERKLAKAIVDMLFPPKVDDGNN